MIFAVGSWAGYPVFLLFCFFSKLFCFFHFSYVFCSFFFFIKHIFYMFSPSLFKLLHLQSNKHITTTTTTNINILVENIQQHNRKHRNTFFPSRNLRDIYSRSGPGLDIQYFCCFVFLEGFLLFLVFSFFFFLFNFMFSPSLFKLLHLQSNNHITTTTEQT